MERRTGGRAAPAESSLAMTPLNAVGELLELIVALERRVPHVERAGEASIARDAAALKARALKRIEELEAQAGVPTRELHRDG